MVSISLILATARDDYPMIGLPETHIFQPTLKALQRQEFKDFELIVSDCRYERRPDCFNGQFKRDDYPFGIKHVPVKPNFWLERGMWTGPGTWNRGIVEAEGELLVFIDDCSEFPGKDALSLYWEWYRKGFFASALCLYNQGGEPLFRDGKRVQDSRWRYVDVVANGICRFPGQSYYAYSAASLEAILAVNGWDQNFDGEKTLADVDLGIRLEGIGCKFILDRRLTAIENAHNAIPSDTLWYEGLPIRSNYELMRMNRKARRWRANSYTLDEQEIEWLRTHREREDGVPVLEVGGPAYELFTYWAQHQPAFDLREMRL